MAETIYVLTGATSGMGFHVAERLADRSNSLLIVGARHPDKATGLQAVVPSDQLILLPLDVSQLASVAAFAAGVKNRLEGRAKLAGIICNAGLQILGPSRLTEDSVDETFATNHLGHFALIDALMEELAPGASSSRLAAAPTTPTISSLGCSVSAVPIFPMQRPSRRESSADRETRGSLGWTAMRRASSATSSML